MGKQWKQWLTLILASKSTADGDCSHEIKRCLLLGRKIMTIIDSVLKSRDITLLTKVKAVFFLLVVYRCESWTIKKTECWRIDGFQIVVQEKTLESPLDCKEIQPVHPKGNPSWIFIAKDDAEAPILWLPDTKNWLIGKDPDAGKGWRRKEKGTMDWLDGHEFEEAPGVDGQGSMACYSPWDFKELDTTE